MRGGAYGDRSGVEPLSSATAGEFARGVVAANGHGRPGLSDRAAGREGEGAAEVDGAVGGRDGDRPGREEGGRAGSGVGREGTLEVRLATKLFGEMARVGGLECQETDNCWQ